MTALLPPPPAAPPSQRPRLTSVPVWPPEPPPLDLTGRSFLVVHIGPAAHGVVEQWLAQARERGRPVRLWGLPRTDEGSGAELARRLGALCVGARLVIAGPEADVLAMAAHARRAGLVPEEITTFAVGRESLRVFCVHCEVTSRLAADPGAEVDCPGCGTRLEVHEHVSGHRGSYLASAVAGGAS
ncbi:dimethylamine monooxygenase subunit DmmA family protein [Geodermatophilus sp. SYSU D01186]